MVSGEGGGLRRFDDVWGGVVAAGGVDVGGVEGAPGLCVVLEVEW